jgi:hypothetical protein
MNLHKSAVAFWLSRTVYLYNNLFIEVKKNSLKNAKRILIKLGIDSENLNFSYTSNAESNSFSDFSFNHIEYPIEPSQENDLFPNHENYLEIKKRKVYNRKNSFKIGINGKIYHVKKTTLCWMISSNRIKPSVDRNLRFRTRRNI